ncbi:MAG: rubredoxin [Burkholderiales bacterium]|nr:rubredoxin [Burkholderiales bacterium]
MTQFEGSYLGDASKLKDTDCLECKVCHYVYDPDVGDIDQNILPGTPFAQLPEYWCCPVCGCEKELFMVVPKPTDEDK